MDDESGTAPSGCSSACVDYCRGNARKVQTLNRVNALRRQKSHRIGDDFFGHH